MEINYTAGVNRTAKRRELFQKYFYRMKPDDKHIVVDEKGTRTEIPLRAERRKMARAFAAGHWRKMKAQ